MIIGKQNQFKCKENPAVIGDCFTIHGRMRFGNGTPSLRIWQVGTSHYLGVTAGKVADDADEPILPKEIILDAYSTVYGDFEVCPFTKKNEGALQYVCVESGSSLIIEDRNGKLKRIKSKKIN